MELKSITETKKAKRIGRNDFAKLFGALIFLVAVVWYTSLISSDLTTGRTLLIVAAVFGGYMAMNIGANDVANNVGPAVGSKAITLFGAIIIAAIFEALGSLIAGGDVVGTIKEGIINPALINNTDTFIWLMMASLLAGAIWINLATAFGAPVSTTHAIVGAVAGAGVAAAGTTVVDWGTLGEIVFSWVLSPFLGAVVAAGCLLFIKKTILFQEDKQAAAKKIVPLMLAVMMWSFSTYLILKGAQKVLKMGFTSAAIIGTVLGVITYYLVKKAFDKSQNSGGDRESINRYFNIPLIFSAALLSFAHGANDVANAIGPLAGIYDAVAHGGFSDSASIPFWVMFVGAMGIVVGLSLYGPKLIKTVGSEITELDQIRAFCVAMSAALTVIVASQLGLPVSSTHIAVGAVFGVGFLREYLMNNRVIGTLFGARYLREHLLKSRAERTEEIRRVVNLEEEMGKLEEYKQSLESLGKLKKVDPILVKSLIMKITEERALIQNSNGLSQESKLELSKVEKKALKAVRKHELVKRSALKMIVAAWLITVPASAILSAMFYFMLRGMQV